MASFNHFPRISEQLRPVLSQVVRKTAFDCQAMAAAAAPVDTGFLKNSIHTEPGEDDLTMYVKVGASYGIYVEMGTHKMAAQPYFYPAVTKAQAALDAALAAVESKLS